MSDQVFSELLQLRESGRCNMLALQEVFQNALALQLNNLADFVFMDTEEYVSTILSGRCE